MFNSISESDNTDTKPTKRTSVLLSDLRTFDLLLFAGSEPISFIIQSSQLLIQGNGEWSHVGVVLEGKYLPKYLDSSRLYVWESTISIDSPDVLTGKTKSGVQIRDLRDLISKYKGKIGVAKLGKALPSNKVQDTVDHIFEKFKDTSYVRNPIFLIAGLCCCLRFCRPKTKDPGIFCSQFVGEIYKELGVIKDDLNTNEIVPIDFLGNDRDGMEVVVETKIIGLK